MSIAAVLSAHPQFRELGRLIPPQHQWTSDQCIFKVFFKYDSLGHTKLRAQFNTVYLDIFNWKWPSHCFPLLPVYIGVHKSLTPKVFVEGNRINPQGKRWEAEKYHREQLLSIKRSPSFHISHESPLASLSIQHNEDHTWPDNCPVLHVTHAATYFPQTQWFQ